MPLPRAKNSITVGADPELFFTKEGKYYPAIGLVGGTKQFPRKVKGGAVQEDNVMAEFNIPPATSAEKFSDSITRMLEEVDKIATKHGCQTAIVPYAEFETKYLEHPQAKEIGCEPDYNAWTLSQNERPSYYLLKNIRTASGHVHIGFPYPNNSPTSRTKVAVACDLYLGIPSVLLDPDTVRRQFYGKAGAYRPKPYGIEYRVLSNFWLKDIKLRKWVFSSAVMAASNYDYIWQHIRGASRAEEFQRVINYKDTNAAKKIMSNFGISLPV